MYAKVDTKTPIMASTNKRRLPFLHLPFLATLVHLTFLITLQLSSTTLSHQFSTSNPCSLMVNLSSCLTKATLIAGKPQTSSMQVLTTILSKSLDRINVANAMATYIYHQNNETQQRVALTDCTYLMDLSRHHIIDSTLAITRRAWIDAQTWMSATLTNHHTCLDGLGEPAKSAMDSIVQDLMTLTATSLCVLKAISPSNDDYVEKPVVDFPSWLPHHEKKLLEYPFKNEVQPDVVVAADGSGDYETVQQAVDSAPNNSTQRYVIHVKNGVYKETVRIDRKKKNIMIVGEDFDSTIITGSLSNASGVGTYRSATLGAFGAGLILQDLKIENTAGPEGRQAVALLVSGDRSAINRCRIEGYQDTLYAQSNRQFYRDCWISGTVDFIFGNAAVLFQNCQIFARKPPHGQPNTITAQGRNCSIQNTGISFQNCQVLPDDDLRPVMDSFETYLGRPWKTYARVVFMQSFLDEHICPEGWLPWNAEPSTVYYGEYQNLGPGADTSGRVKWPGYHVITDAEEAEAFTVEQLTGRRWLEHTGVPFTPGLY